MRAGLGGSRLEAHPWGQGLSFKIPRVNDTRNAFVISSLRPGHDRPTCACPARPWCPNKRAGAPTLIHLLLRKFDADSHFFTPDDAAMPPRAGAPGGQQQHKGIRQRFHAFKGKTRAASRDVGDQARDRWRAFIDENFSVVME